MKLFNRILAMLLTIVMVLAIAPISAFADAWLGVNSDKTQNGNVTSTDLTFTVDPSALLSYLKKGSIKELLKGISLDGRIGDFITVDEFFEVIPKDKVNDIIDAIIADIDTDVLLSYVDVDKLLGQVNKADLIDLIKDIPNLQDYVKDYDALMNHIGEDNIAGAVGYIKTDLLIENYADKLMNLALGLDDSKLLSIVNVDAAMDLPCVDFSAAVKLSYFQNTIGYGTLADRYISNAALDAFVDANYSRFANSLPDYADTNALAGLFAGFEYADVEPHLDLDATQAILQDTFTVDELLGYWNGSTLLIEDMFNDGMFTVDIYKKLLNGDGTNPAALNLDSLLFGDTANDVEALFEDLTVLITNNVIDVEEMLNGKAPLAPLFTVKELISADVILLDKIEDDNHKYEDMVEISVLKTQLQNALNANTITADDVIDCIKKDASGKPDYTAAVKAIGVDVAVTQTCGYEVLLKNYVTDFNGLLTSIGIDAIIDDILAAGTLSTIFDVNGLVNAIGLPTLAGLVDLPQLAKDLYAAGAHKAVIDMLDFQSYLPLFSSLLNAVETNVQEIKINDTALTEKDGDLLYFNPAAVLEVLENLLPTLDDLSKLGDDGVLMSTSFSITYQSEATDDVAKTKVYTVKFAVTEGIGTIRAAASKLQTLINKVGTIALEDGILVVDVKIPDEFASVVRVALEKLGNASDPAWNTLKDKILAIYESSPSDAVAFFEKLTIEDIVAVLDAVDPEIFGNAYERAMASRYANVLLQYIKEATGYDFTHLTANDLMLKATEIPTFEVFLNKLEAVTKVDISSKLPARINGIWDETVYTALEKVADKAGVEFDLKSILENAAASEDPFAYLYNNVVEKVENSGAIYNAVKTRVLKVADRVLASRIGAKFANLTISDFYAGNAAFHYEKTLTFTPKALIEKAVNKLANVVSSRFSVNLDDVKSLFLGYFTNDTAQLGVDLTLRVTNLYEITFYDEAHNEILTTLVPAGADLATIKDYIPADAKLDFLGWQNATTGELLTKMPRADVAVLPDIEGMHYVTVVDPADTSVIVGGVAIYDGELVDRAELDAIAEDYLKATLPEGTVWTDLDGNEYDFATPVVDDITLTWDSPVPVISWNVTVVDPETQEPVEGLQFVVVDGETLTEDQIAAMNAYVEALMEEGDTLKWINVATGAAFDLNGAITADVTLTWEIVEYVAEYTMTVIPTVDGEELAEDKWITVTVYEGTLLSSYRDALDAQIKTLYPALGENEAHVYAYTHTWALANGAMDWTVEPTADITVYANIAYDYDNAGLQIPGYVNGVDFEIRFEDGVCYVTWLGNDWAAKMDFHMGAAFLRSWSNANGKLVLDSKNSAHKVALSNAMLKKLADKAEALGASDVDFSYDQAAATDVVEALQFNAKSGAAYYAMGFLFDDVAVSLGDFANGEVVITLPFAGAANTTDKKTFIYVSGDANTELVAGQDFTVVNDTVTFNAPHFSDIVLVNKYNLSILDTYDMDLDPSAYDASKLPAGPIADVAGMSGNYYEAGYVFTNVKFTGKTTLTGIEYVKTLINGTAFSGTTFEMPAEAVTVKHVATARTYYVYYYVNGQLQTSLTKSYTIFAATLPTAADVKAVLPGGVTAANGWYWFGLADNFETSQRGVNDVHLFWVNDTETTITVNFYLNKTDATAKATYTYTIAQWKTELATLASKVAAAVANVDNSKAIIWKDANGKALSAYTVADLITAGAAVNFYAEYDLRDYNVFTDGNATVDKSTASAGTVVTVTPANKTGMDASIKVINKATGVEITVTDNKFEMPAADVLVSVTYAPKNINYVDATGANKTGKYGDVLTIVVTIPAGSKLLTNDLTTLDKAPADLVLVSAARGTNNELILTYRYTLTEEGTNEKEFLDAVKALITDADFTAVYMVNGVAYKTAQEAISALPEGVTITKWNEVSENVFVASLEYAAPAGTSAWMIVSIILIVLLVLLIIVLCYVLHVTGKIGTNWFIKFCVAVVSVFFAFCMLVARVALKVLHLFGVKDEDVIEDIPAEPVEDIPAQYVDPNTVGATAEEEAAPAEETPVEEAPAEEVEVEATVEVTEEATEEVAEEATEEPTEEVAEEATEEATEEVAEEATEEVAEEATEEAAEEVAEEATEEATEEAAEKTTKTENKGE